MKSWRDLKKSAITTFLIGLVAILGGIAIIMISDNNNRIENTGFIILFFGGIFWSAAITIQIAIDTQR